MDVYAVCFTDYYLPRVMLLRGKTATKYLTQYRRFRIGDYAAHSAQRLPTITLSRDTFCIFL